MKRFRTTVYLVITACSSAVAGAGPNPGTEPIPQLMADSSLVCKGEVTSAPNVKFVAVPQRFTGTAMVRLDRCFKGALPSSEVPVLFDNLLTAAGSARQVVLYPGDYRLFFLAPQEGKYKPIDDFFGVLPISRLLANATVDRLTDPMLALELDLEAGLDDSDQDRLLDSIRMLGNMKNLHSTAPVKRLLDSPNDLVRSYVYEALLRLGDYSVLPMVASQVMMIKDPKVLSQLEQFLLSDNLILRSDALQAVRRINSPHSAPLFYKLLDDSDVDNRFGAMQGLLTLTGGGDTAWVPSLDEFRQQPDFYAARCKDWWNVEGKRKLLTR